MKYKYPLQEHHANDIHSATGKPLNHIKLENLETLTQDDLSIHAETLLAQAAIAQKAGYQQLARNLQRAAELTRVPNDILIKVYNTMRPRRSTFAEMEAVAELLEITYDAPITAGFVREAAEAYHKRGLLR